MKPDEQRSIDESALQSMELAWMKQEEHEEKKITREEGEEGNVT